MVPMVIAMLRAGWNDNLTAITSALNKFPGIAAKAQRILDMPASTVEANLSGQAQRSVSGPSASSTPPSRDSSTPAPKAHQPSVPIPERRHSQARGMGRRSFGRTGPTLRPVAVSTRGRHIRCHGACGSRRGLGAQGAPPGSQAASPGRAGAPTAPHPTPSPSRWAGPKGDRSPPYKPCGTRAEPTPRRCIPERSAAWPTAGLRRPRLPPPSRSLPGTWRKYGPAAAALADGPFRHPSRIIE